MDAQVFVVALLLLLGCAAIIAGAVMLFGVGVALIVGGVLALVGGWALA